jgi:hypothetical protein
MHKFQDPEECFFLEIITGFCQWPIRSSSIHHVMHHYVVSENISSRLSKLTSRINYGRCRSPTIIDEFILHHLHFSASSSSHKWQGTWNAATSCAKCARKKIEQYMMLCNYHSSAKNQYCNRKLIFCTHAAAHTLATGRLWIRSTVGLQSQRNALSFRPSQRMLSLCVVWLAAQQKKQLFQWIFSFSSRICLVQRNSIDSDFFIYFVRDVFRPQLPVHLRAQKQKNTWRTCWQITCAEMKKTLNKNST